MPSLGTPLKKKNQRDLRPRDHFDYLHFTRWFAETFNVILNPLHVQCVFQENKICWRVCVSNLGGNNCIGVIKSNVKKNKKRIAHIIKSIYESHTVDYILNKNTVSPLLF